MTYQPRPWRVFALFLAVMLGLAGLLYAASLVVFVTVDVTVLLPVPMAATAALEGARFQREERRLPTIREAWLTALRLAGYGTSVVIVLGTLLVSLSPGVLEAIGTSGISVLIVATLVIFTVIGRVFFWLGARLRARRASSGEEP